MRVSLRADPRDEPTSRKELIELNNGGSAPTLTSSLRMNTEGKTGVRLSHLGHMTILTILHVPPFLIGTDSE